MCMKKELYSTIVDALVTDGYIVVENALDKRLITELLKLAQKRTTYKKAGISGAGDLHLDSSRRRDKISWLDEDASAISEYLNFTEGLHQTLNKELYLGLSYYEAHFALYEEGDFYERHLDAFKGSKNRVVTTVFYLNEEWKESDGGELVIYDMNDNIIQKVVPNSGTLVVFLSDKFPHEVLPSNTKRHSIAGWFRIDKRDML